MVYSTNKLKGFFREDPALGKGMCIYIPLALHDPQKEAVLRLRHGLVPPFRDNGLIKHLLVPIRLVSQSVHEHHHGDFSDGQYVRIGRASIRQTDWIDGHPLIMADVFWSHWEIDSGVLEAGHFI